MTNIHDSALKLVDMIQRRAPEYLDLITANDDADFEEAFDAILDKSISHLERNKKQFSKLDENGLTAVIVASLSIPGFTVTQETHSNGHVDLTMEADHRVPARRKLGEAKIYRGPEYHIGGLKQLLGRYTTGRETRALLLVYVQKKNIKTIIEKIRDKMDKDLPLRQKGNTVDHKLKWSFISTHTLSCGDDLDVGHVGCNIYIESLLSKITDLGDRKTS